MTNLLKGPYLHSWKWNFFKNVAGLPEINDMSPTRLNKVKTELLKEYKNAKNKENQFFKDYNISGSNRNKQWAEQYLITKGHEGTYRQKIFKILDDNQFTYILTGQKYQKLLIKRFSEEFEDAIIKSNDLIDDITLSEIRDYLTKASEGIIVTTLQEAMGQIGILGTTKHKNAILQDSNIGYKLQKAIIQDGKFSDIIVPKRERKKQKVKTPKSYKRQFKDVGTLRSSSSPILKKFVDTASKIWSTTREERIEEAIQYFTDKLEEYKIPKDKRKTLISVFRHMLEEDSQDKGYLFGEFNKSKGELQEKAGILVFLDYDNPFSELKGKKEINSLMKQTGQKLVDRMGQSVQSKIDNVLYSPKGRPYYIQQKASTASIYNEFDMTEDIDNLNEDILSSINLGGEISLSNLLQKFKYTKILDDEESELLAYMLVNYNVLYHYGDLHKGNTKNKDGGYNSDGAFVTANIIDQLLSKGVQLFVSDLIQDKFGEFKSFHPWDFIIFRNRWLIPRSMILRSILNFIKDKTDTLMTLRSTSYLKTNKFQPDDFFTMEEEKEEARIEERKKAGKNRIAYDYHNADMVRAGRAGGQAAYQAIKVNNVTLKFKLKNLISLELL